MTGYERRYEGMRWSIWFGSYEGPEKFALNELQRAVQVHAPYVVAVHRADESARKDSEHLILLGTAENNPLIKELAHKGLVSIPDEPEGYCVACFDSPWRDGGRVLAIAGRDANGALYGVMDFLSRTLPARERFDGMQDFVTREYPRISRRGIWTWGYVIYDYRRFIDNMARLKMNTLIAWNDCPPLNSPDIIDYAHSRGVKVILGFHWGWGNEDLDLSKDADRERVKAEVLRNYENDYRHLNIDGIYFQTLTEHHDTSLGGKSVAALARDWVNDISRALLEKNPELYIQFGLHATSIIDDYVDLCDLDPRVSIVWEDAGVIPYAYDPKTYIPAFDGSEGTWALGTVESTTEYSKKLATLREGCEFAMVAKGWTTLLWGVEFEHHGLFILGERDPGFITKRLAERHRRWDEVNVGWQKFYPVSAEFYRAILDCRPSGMLVTGLIEDGMLEEKIQPSAALFAETIWNPFRTDAEIMQLAMSPFYGKIGLR